MARILVHATHGPENPTRAALAFLVAKAALDEGHAVTLFLAGDAANWCATRCSTTCGPGHGSLARAFRRPRRRGARFYVSGLSAKSRGVTEADLAGKPAEFALPQVLVRLSLEHERMFNY